MGIAKQNPKNSAELIRSALEEGVLSPGRMIGSAALTNAGVLGAGYAGGQLAKKASIADVEAQIINKTLPKATILEFMRGEKLLSSPARRAAIGAGVGGVVGAISGGEDNRLRGAAAGAALGAGAGYGAYHTRNAIYRPSDLISISRARQASNAEEAGKALHRAVQSGMLSPQRVLGSAALTGAGVGGAGYWGGRLSRPTVEDVEEESKVAATLRILGVL
jgi:hypothetical protein